MVVGRSEDDGIYKIETIYSLHTGRNKKSSNIASTTRSFSSISSAAAAAFDSNAINSTDAAFSREREVEIGGVHVWLVNY